MLNLPCCYSEQDLNLPLPCYSYKDIYIDSPKNVMKIYCNYLNLKYE